MAVTNHGYTPEYVARHPREFANCERCGRFRWLGAFCECATPDEIERYRAIVENREPRPSQAERSEMRTGDVSEYQTVDVSQNTCAVCGQQAVAWLAVTGQEGRYLCVRHASPQAWEAGFNAGYAKAVIDLGQATPQAESEEG